MRYMFRHSSSAKYATMVTIFDAKVTRYVHSMLSPLSEMDVPNCDLKHMVENPSFFSSNCSLILLEDLQDESVPALAMDTWSTVVLVIVIVACIMINASGKIFTIIYIKERAPKRPLNDMILIDQSLQLLPSILHGILVTSSLLMKKPLGYLLGNYSCTWMYMNSAFHNTILVVNGAGMAFYRLLSYKLINEITIESINRIKRLILWSQLMIGSFIYGLMLLATYYTNMASHLDFCRGYTKDMSYIISEFKNKDPERTHLGKTMKSIALILGKLIILFEFICYVTIMVSVYLHDRKLANNKVIDTQIMKQRSKKNAVTMTGQFLSFMVELGYAIFTLLLYDYDGWGMIRYENVSILLIFCWTGITVIQVATSPEIRRFLKEVDVAPPPSNVNLSYLLNALGLEVEENEEPKNEMEMQTIG